MPDPNRLIIEWLLRTYPDVASPLPGFNMAGDGDGVIRMPNAYHEGSYRELEQCLAELRATRSAAWFHLRHKYMLCSCCHRRRVEIVRKVARGHGKPRVVHTDQWRLVDTHNIRGHRGQRIRLDEAKAAAGVEWIAENWARVSPGRAPFLPVAVAVAAGLLVEKTTGTQVAA